MKPPSTVEARVAEELRNWLSSELEHLDASNTNQFAHHVVTILLHEDLDIEDEPLSAHDDFLRDIYSIRKGQTRDKQKKAAVQFLRNAVCCNDPGEAEIQGVVEELMVKIEETKIKMKSKTSPKRTSVCIQNSFNQSEVKFNPVDRERLYHEAFPSLHSNNCNGSNSTWHKLWLAGTESSDDLKESRPHDGATQPFYMFDCPEEAYACNTARQVFVAALAESGLPSYEATEIVATQAMESSCVASFSDVYACWSVESAFEACTLLRRFVPTTLPLKQISHHLQQASMSLREFSPIVIPVINQSDLHSVHLDPSYEKTLTDHPRLFRPIKDRSDSQCSPVSELDTEVESILSARGSEYKHRTQNQQQDSPLIMSACSHENRQDSDGNKITHPNSASEDPLDDSMLTGSLWNILKDADEDLDTSDNPGEGCRNPDATQEVQSQHFKLYSPLIDTDLKFGCEEFNILGTGNTPYSDIDDVYSFPLHKSDWSKILTDNDPIALYSAPKKQFICKDLEWKSPYSLLRKSPLLVSRDRAAKHARLFAEQDKYANGSGDWAKLESKDDSSPVLLSDVMFGQLMLENACIQVQYYYAVRQTMDIYQEHNYFLQQTSLQNPFMPSQLGSCLSQEGSNFLQRAFVNSYFSNMLSRQTNPTQGLLSALRCSDLEEKWLSRDLVLASELGASRTEVIPGCTCSSWLENNCPLGDSCPFSHPSV